MPVSDELRKLRHATQTPRQIPMDRFPILDLHLDSVLQRRLFGYRIQKKHRAALKGQPLFWHADLPRMREASYKGACLGIHYWPFEREGGWREANKQLDVVDLLTGADNDVVRIGRDLQWSQVADHNGIALTAGVEGAHMLNGKIERIEQLAKRHVSYLTLTHFSRNMAATPSMGRGVDDSQGLTNFGVELVAACEENNIAIDVAHVNTRGVLDTCEVARRPVFCTHTGVCGVHEHARNITDEEIDAIAETGGIIGVIFGPVFLAGSLRANSDIVLDHIEYIVDRVGVDHVAIGTDFDGWLPSIPNDMRDCRDLSILPAKFLDRGFTPEQIASIGWKNAVRVFTEIAE